MQQQKYIKQIYCSTVFPLTNAQRDAEKEINPIARRAIHSIESRTYREWKIFFYFATLIY